MPAARALIVDDSRTAQHRLKKLLDRYRLEVDLAASAEEALGYLSYRMPNVIFMDHHMEGMDGFEALKIIKANPSTATIPVIMYTSKSDDMYAGQAHALGALDTLSKNLMKPSRIEEVLGKLNIIPNDAELENVRVAEQAANSNVIDLNPPPLDNQTNFDADDFKVQIARLFELHIADVRTQIAENTKFIVRRLANEIKNSSNRESRVDDVPISLLNEEALAETSKIGIVSNALLCLILVALAAISFQVFQSQKQSDRLEEKYEQLADLNYQESILLDDMIVAAQPSENISSNDINYRAVFNTLSWAMGIDMHFDYGVEPLNDSQILNLQSLTFRLHDAGFRGFIELNIHLGNFCLISADDGGWTLPPSNTPISECQFLKDQKIDLSAENYTSVTYMQFEQTAAPIQNGDIEYIINVSAFENPKYAYPDIRQSLTAGEWNKIAQQNQQIILLIDAI